MQVHETARQVANVPVSANPVPYDQMKSQCEALVMEKQQKMSVLLSFKHSRADSHGSTRVDGLEMNEACISSKYSHHTYHSFRFQICFFFPWGKCCSDLNITLINCHVLQSSLRSEPEMQSTRKGRMRRSDSLSSESDCSFRLPPASPYDKFLKAAGR